MEVIESLRNEAGVNPQGNELVMGVGGSRSLFDKLEIQVGVVAQVDPGLNPG